jgi:hypothetical protein
MSAYTNFGACPAQTANDNPPEPGSNMEKMLAIGVPLEKGKPGKAPYSYLVVTHAVNDLCLAPDITGLPPSPTWTNRRRLIADAVKGYGAQAPKVPYPRVECFRHYALPTRRAVWQEAALIHASADAAASGLPELVQRGDWAGLIDAARGYREHVTTQTGEHGLWLSLVRVLMPLHRAKPVLMVGTNDDLPAILALHQNAKTG